MQYRINPKTGAKISALAFGCLRLPKDFEETRRLIHYATRQGINYFDTAYIYGNSEAVLGKIFAEDGLRARVHIATKLPYFMVRKPADFERFFQKQLERLQTDYIDYYMIHMLPSLQSWQSLCELGVPDWIQTKKAEGAIRQFGFSFHGPAAEFRALIDAYDWDFTMIQYNYYDEHFQAGQQGLHYAAARKIPVMIMEPLRGGMLVDKLPQAARDVWANAPGERSIVDWTLRWLFNQPQVFTVLSGMRTIDMVTENAALAADAAPNRLTNTELALYDNARNAIRAAIQTPCTACAYCMPCPVGVDIPACLGFLNDTVLEGKWKTMYWYASTTLGRNASLCINCKQCEKNCPQGIPIADMLGRTAKKLEHFPYRLVRAIARKLLRVR